MQVCVCATLTLRPQADDDDAGLRSQLSPPRSRRAAAAQRHERALLACASFGDAGTDCTPNRRNALLARRLCVPTFGLRPTHRLRAALAAGHGVVDGFREGSWARAKSRQHRGRDHQRLHGSRRLASGGSDGFRRHEKPPEKPPPGPAITPATPNLEERRNLHRRSKQ